MKSFTLRPDTFTLNLFTFPGTVKGTLSLARPDCWAGVGLTRNTASATMVGGDFIVGERDGKTQVAAVRGYYPSPKGKAPAGTACNVVML